MTASLKPNPAGLVVGTLTGAGAGIVTYRHARRTELERLPEGVEALDGAAKGRIAIKTTLGATTGLFAGYIGGSLARDVIVENRSGKGLKESFGTVFNKEGLKTALFKGGTNPIVIQTPPLPSADGTAGGTDGKLNTTGGLPGAVDGGLPDDAKLADAAAVPQSTPPEAITDTPTTNTPAATTPAGHPPTAGVVHEYGSLVDRTFGTPSNPGVIAELLEGSSATFPVDGRPVSLADLDAVANAIRRVASDGQVTIALAHGDALSRFKDSLQVALRDELRQLPVDKFGEVAKRVLGPQMALGSQHETSMQIANYLAVNASLVAETRAGLRGGYWGEALRSVALPILP